ncbi:hypothetical protein ACFWNL_27400 [Kitasatospora sp. NPDC058397]|uniref:hypothetical protein n=1 Tax=unclassified Kitasatospora TaxID=2633591 RepID=UPI003648DB8A
MQLTGFMRRRTGVVLATIAAATLAGTVPAHAEGSWSSHISDWTYNFESRRWTDNHADGNWTTVSFSGCYHNGSTDYFNRGGQATIELDRDISWSPDVSYGGRGNSCNTVDWGERTTAGQYYFIFKDDYPLSVDSVYTAY